MDNTALIFGLAVLLVILLAVIFNDRVKAAFKGFSIGTDNRYKENQADIKGSKNKVKQGTHKSPDDSSEKNTMKLEGDENEFEQG
ncbi:MAG: hypothetical protein R2828_35935 [Saprospiraceae bacterium]